MTDQQVLRHIERNPGIRADQIAAHFQTEVSEVSKITKRLKAEKSVKAKGNTRGQTYTVRA